MIYYMAHPVAPLEVTRDGQGIYTRTVRENISRARQYLAALLAAGVPVIAPWIAAVASQGYVETDREAGLAICHELVMRCDGLILVGPDITLGMRSEIEAGKRVDVRVLYVDGPPEMAAREIAEELAGRCERHRLACQVDPV